MLLRETGAPSVDPLVLRVVRTLLTARRAPLAMNRIGGTPARDVAFSVLIAPPVTA